MRESYLRLAYHYKKSLLFAIILVFLGHTIYFMPTPSNRPILNLPIDQPQNQLQPLPVPVPQPLPELKIDDLDLNSDLEESLMSLDQTDSRLIKYSRIKYLTPPSRLPYQDVGRVTPDAFSSLVAEIFENKRNGIFIEAGANDGVHASHSLYLEKHLNWTGLLIECNPNLIPKLKSRHRKAWIASVCLAPGIKPGILNFSIPYEWTPSGTFGKPWKHNSGKLDRWFQLEVETMPLFPLLAGIGFNEIDYFSFDIEGSELAVLRGFPFDRVTFKLLIIEIYFYKDEQKKELNELMQTNNYHFVSDFEYDKIYVHGSVKDKLNLKRFEKKWI